MTYFGILYWFILPPLLVLAAVVARDLWLWLWRRNGSLDKKAYCTLLALVAAALLYTTPWDNYLVATGVWSYAPSLVTGLTLGYVPIEEYTFFMMQTLLTGLWTLGLLRRIYPAAVQVADRPPMCKWAGFGVALLWAASTAVLLAGWAPARYLALILSWGLVPVLIQVAFGADILWAQRRALVPAVLLPTLYLWAVDYLALRGGIWSIDPRQTTGLILGALPFEEMVFFSITNLIIAFGMTLILAEASHVRVRQWAEQWRGIQNQVEKR